MAWQQHGYILEYSRSHPLANKNGDLRVHRRVLWDNLYAGEDCDPFTTYAWCHWCSYQIPWQSETGKWIDCVNVDHLDEDKTNNTFRNLVPSCGWCNYYRSTWMKKYPTFWDFARLAMASTPPWDRPSPKRLLNELQAAIDSDLEGLDHVTYQLI
jgi:hypothetical protein